jgi:tubulin polyglutamylase complex subunit 2
MPLSTEAFDQIALGVVSFLENKPGVSHIAFDERDGVGSHQLDAWEQANAPCRLPPDLRALYQITDGLALRWKLRFREKDLPLGCMQLNALHQVARVQVEDDDVLGDRGGGGVGSVQTGGGGEAALAARLDAADTRAFALNGSDCGVAALLYRGGRAAAAPEVWFEDRAGTWHFMAATFNDYFRLLVMHLGIPAWQYAFTDVGLDPVTKQWFRLLCPERLQIDVLGAEAAARARARVSEQEARSKKGGGGGRNDDT